MSGDLKFKIDAYMDTPTSATQYSQSLFKQIWDFFKQLEVEGYVTEVARNNGGGGTGFHDETPFGNHSWFLIRYEISDVRYFPYYVLFQYSTTNNFGSTSPGSPGKINGSTGSSGINIGFSVSAAFDSMGVPASPWGGTTGSLGSDTKGSPVWVAPIGGSVYVLPRSNSNIATFAATKEDMAGFTTGTAPTSTRLTCISDRDNFFINCTSNNNRADNLFSFGVGKYIASPEVSVKFPIFMWTGLTGNFFNDTSIWGNSITGSVPSGGVGAGGDEDVRPMSFAWDSSLNRSDLNANADITNSFGFYPISVLAGLRPIGWTDPEFWKVCYNMVPKDTDVDLKWMVFGDSTAINTPNLAVRWDNESVRGSSVKRNGIIK